MIRTHKQDWSSVKIASYMVIIALSITFLYVAKSIMVPLAYASLISLLLHPICNFFEENGFGRIPSILLTFLVMLLATAGILALLSAQIYSFVNEIQDIESRINVLLDDVEWFLYKNFNYQINRKTLNIEALNRFVESGILADTFRTFLNLFNLLGLVPVYVFLILLYRHSFNSFFMVITPIEKHRTVKRMIGQIQRVVQNYITGLITVMAIVATLNSIVLYCIGIDYAIFFGFFAALLMVVPYLGLIVGMIIPTIYAFLTKDSIWYPVAVVAAMSTIQFLEGNFITPRITGHKVKVNALASIVALVVGGFLWGIPGLILSMPAVAIGKVIMDNIDGVKHVGFLLGTEMYVPKHRAQEQSVLFRHRKK